MNMHDYYKWSIFTSSTLHFIYSSNQLFFVVELYFVLVSYQTIKTSIFELLSINKTKMKNINIIGIEQIL